MSIIRNIASIFAPGAPSAKQTSGVIRMEPLAPAARYVTQLLESLLDGRRDSVVLRSSEDLPIVGRGGREPASGAMPQFSEVANRLKFLGRLNPVTYPDGTQAEFTIEFRSRTAVANISFHDSGPDPSCTVRIRWKEA